jgi:hypothetical protein
MMEEGCRWQVLHDVTQCHCVKRLNRRDYTAFFGLLLALLCCCTLLLYIRNVKSFRCWRNEGDLSRSRLVLIIWLFNDVTLTVASGHEWWIGKNLKRSGTIS